MRATKPIVIKIGETRIDREGVKQMLAALGVSQEGSTRFEKAPDTGETLIELAGRICYESFEIGLNPNVTKIRLDPKDYFENLLRKGDGSVAEHGLVNFVMIGVSRVMTHELVRHRVGVAVSQLTEVETVVNTENVSGTPELLMVMFCGAGTAPLAA